MIEENYPGIFNAADIASKKAQNRFVWFNQSILFLLVTSTFSSAIQTAPRWLIIISSCLLVVSTIISVLILIFRPEKYWYDGRAIAESVKSLTWKFMMGTTPFSIHIKLEEAEEMFVKNLKQIIGQKRDFFVLIGEKFSEGDQLTNTMIQCREKSLFEKINIYTNERLEEQRKWYFNKSKKNRKHNYISFSFLIGFQLLAIAVLILELYSTIELSLSPILACLATSTIAWLQLKRYQELTESYAITATELSLIKSKIKHITTEIDFEKFVDDAETAISREHILWLARRDSIELFK